MGRYRFLNPPTGRREQILIIGRHADPHVMAVESSLVNRGERCAVLDTSKFPKEAILTAHLASKGQTVIIKTSEEDIDLGAIKSVWYRRQQKFVFTEKIPKDYSAFCMRETKDVFEALWACTPALWVSPPHCIRVAELKLYQLHAAASLGLRVPRTVVTNDPSEAQRFAQSSTNKVVVKTISKPFVGANRNKFIYTHLLTQADLKHLDEVAYSPTLLQEYVPKKYDLRVTVIGRSVFAVAIDSQKHKLSMVDWRQIDPQYLQHHKCPLNPRLRRSILALTHSLGLRFSSMDFVVTPDGNPVFLDLNPNGQWLWLEECAGVPLTNAMADLLARGISAHTYTRKRK